MNIQKGRYKLISENLIDSSREVFDFSEEVKNFVPDGEEVLEVSVATIDSFTCLFPSPEYLGSYLEKKTVIDREEREKKYYISYKHKISKEEACLSTVWNDPVLQDIASHAKGGRVDFTNSVTKETFSNIIRELRSKKSKFGTELLASLNNDVHINDYSKMLVKKCIFPTSSYESFLDIKLRETFSNYREFRALYLAYTKYLQRMQKEKEHSLAKK